MKAGENSSYSDWAYIIDKDYAKSPEHYIRAFLLIQSDLIKIFEYIEPAEESLNVYSYRIHELFMRACIEIEANFKAILSENTYTPKINRYEKPILNMNVYKIVDFTHHLSSYEVILPIWRGNTKKFSPFSAWKNKNHLEWYEAYNASKHDRQDEFKQANMENLLNAVIALVVLLSSQFKKYDFSPKSMGLALKGYDYYDLDPAIGDFFRIQFPNDWDENELYDFNWVTLKEEDNRFQKFDYNSIKYL